MKTQTYLGEVPVDISTHEEYKNYTPKDWAMYFITAYGQIQGDHHSKWVIDQVARILLGAAITVKKASWSDGTVDYRISVDEDKPSQEYLAWVKEAKDEGYDYDEGIAP